MDYGELLHDFVDGTLDSGQESELFAQLASSEGLRSEMKQFIEFERTARFDTGAYSPSAETTAGIFARVGITNPAFTLAPAGNAGAGIIATLGKYSQGIIGGVIAAILASTVMYFAMQNTGSVSPENQNQIAGNNVEQQNNTEPIQSLDNNIPLVKSEEKSEPKVIERIIIKYIDRPVIQEVASVEETEPLAAFEQPVASIEPAPIKNMVWCYPENMFSDINNNVSMNPIAAESYSFYPDMTISNFLSDLGVSVEVTGADYFMFPSEKVAKSSPPFFENMKIAVLFRLSDDLQLGAELRQEFFYHQYRGFEGETEYEYYQNNNYLTGGVLVRWTPIDFKYASIFTQGSIGTNLAGPVGRLMLGTIISPSEDYSFVIGVEESTLFYNHNAKWQPASKIGFHYGMMFNF
ncbi:hypothetical protein ACFLSQ_04505 [Bacteroidota bacterium]